MWFTQTDQLTPKMEKRKAKGLAVDGRYARVIVVTLGPTIKMGANYHKLLAIGDPADKMKDLKEGDRIKVVGRLGYSYVRKYGKIWRILVDQVEILPNEPMPLYDFMIKRDWKPFNPEAKYRIQVSATDDEVPF